MLSVFPEKKKNNLKSTKFRILIQQTQHMSTNIITACTKSVRYLNPQQRNFLLTNLFAKTKTYCFLLNKDLN